MLYHLAPSTGRRVLKLGADEVEAEGRSPVHSVTNEDAVRPVREALAGERGQRSDEIEAIRFDPVSFFPGPRGQALHQQPVGAADVEEGSVTVYRRDDRTPCSLPAGPVPVKPRSSARVTRLEVSPLQQSTSLPVITVVARQFRGPHSC